MKIGQNYVKKRYKIYFPFARASGDAPPARFHDSKPLEFIDSRLAISDASYACLITSMSRTPTTINMKGK